MGLTSRSLAPIAKRGIHKRESGDGGSIGPHHPWSERNRQDKRLCQQRCPLLALEPALRSDQHGERPGRQGFQRLERRNMRRPFVGEDEPPPLVPAVEQLGKLLRLQDFRHAQDAALLGGLDGVGMQALALDALGYGVARDDRAERACAKFGCFLHHIVEPGALEQREQIVQVGSLILRAGLVVEADLCLLLASLAELGPPLAVAAVEQKEVVSLLEAQHISEVMRLVLAERYGRARFELRGDEQALGL